MALSDVGKQRVSGPAAICEPPPWTEQQWVTLRNVIDLRELMLNMFDL